MAVGRQRKQRREEPAGINGPHLEHAAPNVIGRAVEISGLVDGQPGRRILMRVRALEEVNYAVSLRLYRWDGRRRRSRTPSRGQAQLVLIRKLTSKIGAAIRCWAMLITPNSSFVAEEYRLA